MAWIGASKEIRITEQVGHASATPFVIGQALSNTRFDFTPDEFYLAAAFCSHMHPVTPDAAGPEAAMIRALVERHVDDTKDSFAVEATADAFKDYVKSYFAGTVATALAYLAMIRSGYDWAGHFEHFRIAGTKGRTPDFVFSSSTLGTSLVESKGTRSAAKVTFGATVEKGYLEQVERHLGTSLSDGCIAFHGYCIGAWMTSVSGAELVVHHTNPTMASLPYHPRPSGDADDSSLELVQFHDLATALNVVFGRGIGEALRFGNDFRLPQLVKFRWRDLEWISPYSRGMNYSAEFRRHYRGPFGTQELRQRKIFAIEARNLAAILSRNDESGHYMERPKIFRTFERESREPLPSAGALLPDGLALVPWLERVRPRRVLWDALRGQFITD